MENKTHQIAASPRKIPLCFVIVVPFVLQIVGAVGLVGYLSFKNGQQAVEDLANQVMKKVGDRIEERLNSYLSTPHLINSVNESSINSGQLNLKDFNELKFTFLQQQKLFILVKSICFTNDEGEIIWTQRQKYGSFVLGILKKSDKGKLHTYKLDYQTNKFKLEKVFPNYEPRQRPWYKTAQAAGKQTWSPIYPWVVEANVGIAAVTPIYEAPGKLKGVFSVDLVLSDISKFLSSFKISPSGQTFIMERSGEIIATSTDENPFSISSKGKAIARLKAVDSREPLTRSTAQYLQKHFNTLTTIKTTQEIEFTQKGKRQFVQVTPFRDKFGLDWLIVVVVPEHDFMAKIYANTRTTFLLCLGALGVSIVLGIATARSITLPLLRLSKASQAIANGELDQNVEITGIDEVAMMAQSFNQMSQQLQQSQQQLENYSRSLESQINQRTQELQQEISERQLLAEKLRTSEAEVRAFFEAMTDIVLMINAENNDIKVAPTNPSRLYPPDIDILSQTIEQFFLDENAELFKSNIRHALDTQQIVNFEYSLPVGESKIWFAASISPTTENSVAWVARDISDAVAAALQRKQREEALQLIVEGTASKTGSEFFHYCVRYLAEVLQVRYALVTELVDTAPTKLHRLAFWTGESWNYEIEHSLKDTPCENVIAQKRICYYPDGVQEYFPDNRDLINWGIVSYLGIPLVDSAGKLLGHLAVLDVKPMSSELGNQLILRIFAARAGAELERKQAEEKLQRRAITDSMLSSISRAFLDQDIDTAINFTLQVIGEFTDSDRSYIFRYTDNQSKLYNTHEWCAPGIQPSIDQLQGLPVEDYHWLHSELLSANILQIPCVADLPPEALLGKAELERSSIQSLLAVPIIYGGIVVGSMGLDAVRSSQIWTEEDINLLKLVSEIVAIGLARNEAEVAQQHATEAAIAANRAKSEFLANMSHELRTPLTAILGLSEVLRDEVFGPLTAKQHQKLATIEQSGKHLLELINDVLDLAKIESGKMELQLAPTDIQGLCDASLAFVRQQAHQKQIKLTSQVPPRISKVVVDERRIRQVLINLLSNAVKFTPEGGAVWLEVKADPENEVLQFSIVDTGIGIALENIGKLFQPFVQLESSFSKRYTGTGLGLALVRQVVELHGGSIRLESEVGQGSRFTVSLPWIQEKIQSVSKSPIPNSLFPFPSSPLLNLHKVLIIEDSAPAAEQVARYLAELGVTNSVIHALGTGTVEEALRLKPDAIILDLQLPDRSGWDVLAQLKANSETQNIPVLIMSVVDEPALPEELEVCEYLVKPFSRSQFQIAWRKVLLAQQRSASSVAAAAPSPLVLLTEDNEANISTIMEYLEVRGYRVAIALNGREAVQLTKELNPDLILMDVQMPEMDGLEATRQIRADRTKTQIPIIALTSLAMPGDREKCLEAGMNEYLTKPVSLKKLVEAIARHLGQVNS